MCCDIAAHAVPAGLILLTALGSAFAGPGAPGLAEGDGWRQRLAARRAGPAVIVHRGASAFAAENTLEACASAMDFGADGCEIDLRCTADGVLLLFHDDTLDRSFDAFGPVRDYSWDSLSPLTPSGDARRGRPFPSFAALLRLAVQRGMLLHLDIKEAGLEERVAQMLDEAGAWDLVVYINDYNSARLRANPRYSPLTYKGPGLYDRRMDMDPDAVRRQLALPGQLIMVDDPRVASCVLGREAFRPVPLPRRQPEALTTGEPTPPDAFNIARFVRDLEAGMRESADRIPAMLTRSFSDRRPRAGLEDSRRWTAERIVRRAWAAVRLRRSGAKTTDLVARLEFQVTHRSEHPDWRFHGLDGAMAARALGRLRSQGSAEVLIEAVTRHGSATGEGAFAPWFESGLQREALIALGRIRSARAVEFLRWYVLLNENEAASFGHPQFETATLALLGSSPGTEEIGALLASGNSTVLGTALQYCLDHPMQITRDALRNSAPWAIGLPSAAAARD